MPPTTRRGVIKVDKALTDFSIKFQNGSLIADLVCPRIKVSMPSDVYYIFERNDFRIASSLKADNAPPNYIDAFKAKTASYLCEKYALADKISDREKMNADPAIDPAFAVTDGITNRLIIGREKRVADKFTTLANWTGGVTRTGAQRWNDPSFASDGDCSIAKTINAAKESVRRLIGTQPNTIIFPAAVADVVKIDSEIIQLLKYTNSTLLTNGDLPPTMWNMTVHIAGGIYDSAEEGQTFSGADVWGKDVWIGWVSPQPKALRTFTAALTMESLARNARRWRDEELECDKVEVGEMLDEKIVSADCGYLIKAAIL